MANSKNITFDQLQNALSRVKSALDGKANTSHGNHVPKTETANNARFLRNDNTWQTVTPVNIGAADRSHTHGEYINQNTFTNVKIGDTTIEADSPTDTLTLNAGANVTITPDAINDTVTIEAKDTIYTHPTNPGNKHIPSGGSSGQILRWSEDGTAAWGSENNTFTNGSVGGFTVTPENLVGNNVGMTSSSGHGYAFWAGANGAENSESAPFKVGHEGKLYAYNAVLAGTLDGNATTATRLQAAHKFTIGNSEKYFDGSADVAWTLDEIGASSVNHMHTSIDHLGNVPAQSTGERPPKNGISMNLVYNNGYPYSYGNVLNLKGTGDGQLFIGWSGSTGAHAPVYVRSKRDTGDAWSDWAQFYTTANPQSDITGNAGTATKLAVAKTITIGNTGKSFDGSGNVSWSLDEIGAVSPSHTHDRIVDSNNSIIVAQANDHCGLDAVNNVNVATWYGFSISNNCSNTDNYGQVTFSVDARSGQVWTRGTVNAPGFSGALYGNANTATTLANSRKFTIGNAERYFNGSSDVSWTLDEMGVTSAIAQSGNSILNTVSNTYATKAELNDLSIGGRNYYTKTSSIFALTSEGTITRDNSINGFVLTAGDNGNVLCRIVCIWEGYKYYTVSGYFKADTQCNAHIDICDYDIGNKSVPTTYTKFSGTAYVDRATDDIYNFVDIECSGVGAGNKVYIKDFKVEEGQKATSWTPAPEDVDNSINAVDNKFANYTTKAEFNNLKIGGTNLLLNSSFAKGVNDWLVNMVPWSDVAIIDESLSPTGKAVKVTVNSTSGGWGIYQVVASRRTGNFTLSFYAKADTDNYNIYAGQEWSPTKDFTLTTNWTKYTYTYDRTYTSANAIIFYTKENANNGAFYLHSIKLEYGDKATDWSPAPQDIDASIAVVDNKFTNYSTTNQMNSAIQVAENDAKMDIRHNYVTKHEAAHYFEGENKWKLDLYSLGSMSASATPTKELIIQNNCQYQRSYLVEHPSYEGEHYGDNYVGYATTYMHFTEDYQWNGRVVTDDNGSVYLNDVLVAETTTCQLMNITLNFTAGWNKLEVLYAEGGGGDGWQFNPEIIVVPGGIMNKMNCYGPNSIGESLKENYLTKTETNDKINNIRIGGTNLFRGTANLDSKYWASENVSLTDSYYRGSRIYRTGTAWADYNYPVSQLFEDDVIELNTEYIFSCYARTNNGDYRPNLGIYGDPAHMEGNGQYIGTVGTEWRQYSGIIKFYDGDRSYPLRIEPTTASGDDNKYIEVCGLKLEKGNKATDWSPNPNDTNIVNPNLLRNGRFKGLHAGVVDNVPDWIASGGLTVWRDIGQPGYENKGCIYFHKEALDGAGCYLYQDLDIDDIGRNIPLTLSFDAWREGTISEVGCRVEYINVNKDAILASKNLNVNDFAGNLDSNGHRSYTFTTSNDSNVKYLRIVFYYISADGATGGYLATLGNVKLEHGMCETPWLQTQQESIATKISGSGGYNLLRNGRALNGTSYWNDNGGGIAVYSNNAPTIDHKYFCTSFPSGITYYDWIQLENNTHYIYSAKIFLSEPITFSGITPLHYWATPNKSGGQGQASIVRSSHEGQTIPAGQWVDVWVEYVTAPRDTVWFRPFIYQDSSTCSISVTDLMLCKGSVPFAWSPHPNEIYDGCTQIDKDGIKVLNTGISNNSFTHTSSNGFTLHKDGENLLNFGSDGLHVKGNIVATSGSIPSSILNGQVPDNLVGEWIRNGATNGSNAITRLNSSAAAWDNAYNRVAEWAYGSVGGSTTINGGKIQSNTITPQHLAISDFSNYSQLRVGHNLSNKYGTAAYVNNDVDNHCYWCNGDNEYFPFTVNETVNPFKYGDKVGFKFDAYVQNALDVRIGIWFYLNNDCNDYMAERTADVHLNPGWNSYSAQVTIDCTEVRRAKSVAILIYKGVNNYIEVRNAVISRMISNAMIEDGAVTARKLGTIGGFQVEDRLLRGRNGTEGNNYVGMSGDGFGWAFWAGAYNGGDAPFHVGHEGHLYATNATLAGTLDGNATTASRLQSARTLTIGNTGKNFDGSGNVSWSLGEIGAAASGHTHDSITSSNTYITTVGNDTYSLDMPNNIDISSWFGVSITNNCANTPNYRQTTVAINARSGEASFRGNITAHGAYMTNNIVFSEAGTSNSSAPGLVWNGSTDGADLYYRTLETDQGQLLINLRDDSNATLAIAWNGEVKATFDSNGYYSGSCYEASAANKLNSRGVVQCETGTDRSAVDGLSTTQVYNSGHPTPYGNVLSLRGMGDGQILVGWSGASGAHAPVYVRSKRDNGDAPWSDWAQFYTTAHPQSDISGNAGSANRLQYARTFTVGNTGKNFDGTNNISWSLDQIGAAPSSHGHNFMYVKGTNTIGSVNDDTTGNWGAQGNSVHWYAGIEGVLHDQPSSWGYLLNIGQGAEVHQLWMTQASGNLYHRGGNQSGWSGSWRTILDSDNYSTWVAAKSHTHDYAASNHTHNYAASNHNHDSAYLKLSGGTLSGSLTVNNNVYSQGFCVSKNNKEVWFDIGDNDTYIWASGANKSLQITHGGDLNFNGQPVLYGGRGNNYDTAVGTIYFNNAATSHKGRISCYNNTDGDYVQVALRTADATANYLSVRTDTVNFGSPIVVQGHKLTIQESAPSNPAKGDVWINIG